MTRPTSAAPRILSVLANGPMTAWEIAQRVEIKPIGVQSALRAMVRKRQVARLKRGREYEPYRYRLRDVA